MIAKTIYGAGGAYLLVMSVWSFPVSIALGALMAGSGGAGIILAWKAPV